MMRTFLSLMIFTAVIASATSDAIAAQDAVMYSCGTRAAGGSFYSDAGTLQCEDGPGADKSVIAENDKGSPIFCMYSAMCTAVTAKVRSIVLEIYNERAAKKLNDWQDISDEDMNQTVITAVQKRLLPQVWQETAVQCMGTKFADGSPNCPGVNDCVNNKGKNSALFFVKNYDKKYPVNADSKGFRVRKIGPDAPNGVKR